MKKLLLTALITISPMTFAKDFNPDLLVGTWQCKTTFNYPEIHLFGKENYTVTYKKDHTYQQSSVMDSVTDGQKNTVKMQATGQWKIENNILSDNIENLISYHATNQQLEEYYQVEQSMREDKTFNNFKILALSSNKIILALTGKEDFEKNAEFRDICNRIK